MTNQILVPTAARVKLQTRATLLPHPDPLFLVVEGGTGTPRANSYASLQYAHAYFIGRRLFSSAWVTATDDVKTVALKQASALLDAEFYWAGTGVVLETQGLAWPRTEARDRYNNLIVGVPKAVRDATCELALYLLAQDRLVAREGVGIDTLRVDVISIKFDKREAPQTFPEYIARSLNGYGTPLRSAQQVRNVKLFRV